MMKWLVRWVLVAVVALHAVPAGAAPVPLEDFFKDPEFSAVSLSPTGEFITMSVPQNDRTILAAFRVQDMQLLGKWDFGAKNHVDSVRWVNDRRFFISVSRKLGRYDFRVGTPDLHASDVDGKRRIAIPNGGLYSIVDTLESEPDSILVQRSVDSAFLFKMNVNTGEVRTVATAPVRFGSFLVDHEHTLRYVIGTEENNEQVTLRRDGDAWTEVHRAPMGGAQRSPIGFDRDNRRVYTLISEDGGPGKLYLVDPETEQRELVAENPDVSTGRLLTSSDGRDLLAVTYQAGLPEVDFINAGHAESKTYAGLINAFPRHALSFTGISRDGRHVLFRAYSDVDPGSYYLFDRQTNSARFLLASMDWIKPEQMSPVRPFDFVARDGTRVHGYLTVPRGSDASNLPMVMFPHGGPHGIRDYWGFDRDAQFLASRGYAVLQVNFRGSGGYGNAFERKGYRSWGTAMIDDMTDAVGWAVKSGIADPQRICTYGASYGGYAALQSVAREQSLYKCAIGYVGVYSLPLMFKDGDIPKQENGRSFLRQVMPESQGEQQAQSPAFNADRIQVPVMLVHGERDERVPMSQYRALKSALVAAGRPPEVEILAPREGHGFYDLDNNVRLYTALEAFLDKHIGSASAQPSN